MYFRIMRLWSYSVPVCVTTSGSTRSESLVCCRTTLNWRRRTSAYKNKFLPSNKARLEAQIIGQIIINDKPSQQSLCLLCAR